MAALIGVLNIIIIILVNFDHPQVGIIYVIMLQLNFTIQMAALIGFPNIIKFQLILTTQMAAQVGVTNVIIF